ncbi:hypothetical protein [Amycolatopsis australiensis]|uniref:Uncharacterized protein n=1 Tax=Amycolatopsis australiensis TaxID=546364 RepID=A0A1K1R0S9_9PSEU|nr:hypothetical protein [Amycolatopsis australiensis]SFW65802.1 hypothetical protein SAMN04489730_2537 [Amycolatopsis australiensis]
MFAGALNHADLGAVRAWVAKAPWRCPNAVQLLLQDQHEVFFRLWMLRDGQLRQYAPEKPHEDDPDFEDG